MVYSSGYLVQYSQCWMCRTKVKFTSPWIIINPLNAELNPICHLLALLGGATIVVISRLRVKLWQSVWYWISSWYSQMYRAKDKFTSFTLLNKSIGHSILQPVTNRWFMINVVIIDSINFTTRVIISKVLQI